MILVSKYFSETQKKQTGFTLIELLIVMLLVGLSASLVGPSLYQQYDKTRLMQQRQKVEFSLKYLAQVAFYNQKVIEVSFNGSEVTAQYKKMNKKQVIEGDSDFEGNSFEVNSFQESNEEQDPVDISETKTLFSESYPGLFFKPITIEIDANGIAEASNISVFQNEIERTIRFHHVIKKTVRNDAD